MSARILGINGNLLLGLNIGALAVSAWLAGLNFGAGNYGVGGLDMFACATNVAAIILAKPRRTDGAA